MNLRQVSALFCFTLLMAQQGFAATPTQVRQGIASAATPAAAEIPAFLSFRIAQLKAENLSTEVANQAALIPILAADFKRKNKGAPQSDAAWTAAAKSQIESNKTTALTTSDDHYTAIRGGAKFDEVHEFVHILSGPGGDSPLFQFQTNFNEGAINYFAELAAKQAQVTVETRYTKETPIVKRLVKLIGANGPEKLYNATFKGDIDGFFAAAGAAYVALGDKRPNGSNKAFSEKSWTAPAAAAEFKKQAQNWSVKFFEDRTPAL